VALGLKMEEMPFAKSTLWLFRTQLIVRGEAFSMFKESLRHARESGYLKSRKVKVDTRHVACNRERCDCGHI